MRLPKNLRLRPPSLGVEPSVGFGAGPAGRFRGEFCRTVLIRGGGRVWSGLGRQLRQPDEAVGGGGEDEDPVDARDALVTGLAQSTGGPAPAEHLFEVLADAQKGRRSQDDAWCGR